MDEPFTMTDADARPANASIVEDIIELSLLTAPRSGSAADIAWEEPPEGF